VPPTGVTGAVFVRGRLLLSGESGGRHQVWAVNTRTGARRLEIQMEVCGESEGLDTVRTLGGTLHWLLSPFDPGCTLTFGPSSALVHFVRRHGRARLDVKVLDSSAPALPGEVSVRVEVTRRGRPVPGASVRFAGGSARTGPHGVAVVRAQLELPGRFKALATLGRRYGLSPLVPVGLAAASAGAAPRFRVGLG
jgi:hypothetical protein